mmetsp:Transcript_33681/g.100390  ORF Transcript_33681/g.100390 Transcript_33681/m.100390 type:complete len:115 (-) Transcript_33681:2004-2348(-)
MRRPDRVDETVRRCCSRGGGHQGREESRAESHHGASAWRLLSLVPDVRSFGPVTYPAAEWSQRAVRRCPFQYKITYTITWRESHRKSLGMTTMIPSFTSSKNDIKIQGRSKCTQ